MSQPTVSILVPVYNVERYLAQCLDSLCAQTLHDIEIICIDDGSTDSSPSIMADYAVRDGRIRVITKSNTGYGDSMNRGLAEADGAWVGICEPDDFCDKHMYAALVRAGERHSGGAHRPDLPRLRYVGDLHRAGAVGLAAQEVPRAVERGNRQRGHGSEYAAVCASPFTADRNRRSHHSLTRNILRLYLPVCLL